MVVTLFAIKSETQHKHTHKTQFFSKLNKNVLHLFATN